MEKFFDNFVWMIPNLALASLGFVFGLFYLNSKNIFLRTIFFVLWILFLPNTIYLLTDIQHYFVQLTEVDLFGAFLLTVQYLVLMAFGVLTYFAGMMPMEKYFRRHKSKKNFDYMFVIFNFAIAFAVVLGKIERTHSWYVFTQPIRVLEDIVSVLTTPILLTLVILFGIFVNVIYFGFRRRFSKLK